MTNYNRLCGKRKFGCKKGGELKHTGFATIIRLVKRVFVVVLATVFVMVLYPDKRWIEEQQYHKQGRKSI